jgi:hypothetical protein
VPLLLTYTFTISGGYGSIVVSTTPMSKSYPFLLQIGFFEAERDRPAEPEAEERVRRRILVGPGGDSAGPTRSADRSVPAGSRAGPRCPAGR